MKAATVLLAALLAGGTGLAALATFASLGVARADELTGVSLRQESRRAPAGFFVAYRSHRGGGLRGGK